MYLGVVSRSYPTYMPSLSMYINGFYSYHKDKLDDVHERPTDKQV